MEARPAPLAGGRRQPSLPVRLDTGCSRRADSHRDSQSGQSPRRSSNQGTSAAAAGTGCTAHSHSGSLSWIARACCLTAAAACSLNWRGRQHLKLHRCAAHTNQDSGCDNSLVGCQTESQSFAPQAHGALTLVQGPLLQPLIWELNKPTAPTPTGGGAVSH